MIRLFQIFTYKSHSFIHLFIPLTFYSLQKIHIFMYFLTIPWVHKDLCHEKFQGPNYYKLFLKINYINAKYYFLEHMLFSFLVK